MSRSTVIFVVLALLVVGCGGGESTTETTADAATTIAAADTTAPVETTVTTTAPAPTTVATTTTIAPTTTAAPSTTTTTSAAPSTTVAPVRSDDFCDNVNALLVTNEEFVTKLMSGDTSHVESSIEQMPKLTAAARDTAPPEMADNFDLIVAFIDKQVQALGKVDLSDAEAVADAMAMEMDEPTNTAFDAMFEYGETECGYTSGMDLEAPEPPDCEVLDAAAAAKAAGVDIDLDAPRMDASFSLPGFAIDGCGYESGRMVVTAITFTNLDTIVEDYRSNAMNNGGEVIGADLGSLPETTLITSQNGTLTVTVFEAETPFAIGFAEDQVEPAKVIAAAQAILATQD